MKSCGGVGVLIHIYLTSALVAVSGHLHAPATLPKWKCPLVHIG
jgi:hypothetical protein